jgi:hypothetical protein
VNDGTNLAQEIPKVAKMAKQFETRSEDVQALLIRARQVDPWCDEGAVRGYLSEIVEAEVILESVDLHSVPLSVSFCASWEDEPKP